VLISDLKQGTRSDDLTPVAGGSFLVGDGITRNASGISTWLSPIQMFLPYTLILHLGRRAIATTKKSAKASDWREEEPTKGTVLAEIKHSMLQGYAPTPQYPRSQPNQLCFESMASFSLIERADLSFGSSR
jgi:hypothetical protein